MNIGNLEVYGVIYLIRNKINNKHYIGQTINNRGFNGRYEATGKGVDRVLNYYKKRKEYTKNYNTYLYNSIVKYGTTNFETIEIFDIAFSKEELDIKECLWINYFDCINNGYNNKEGGSRGKLSEETRKKMSESSKGYVPTLETRQKLSNVLKGRVVTDKWKENMIKNHANVSGENNPNYGKNMSQIQKNKISKTRKEKGYSKGKNNPMYGIHMKGADNPNSKKVICLTINKIFNTCGEGASYYNRAKSSLCLHLKGKRKSCGKSEDGTPLVWMYYEDYIKQNKLLIHNINLGQAI